MKGESYTPDAQHLFGISEDAAKISQSDAYLFHHFLAQLIHLSKRAHTNIQIAVSFLCTRVRGPGSYEYKKLSRVIKYIQGIIGH